MACCRRRPQDPAPIARAAPLVAACLMAVAQPDAEVANGHHLQGPGKQEGHRGVSPVQATVHPSALARQAVELPLAEPNWYLFC